MFFSQKLCTYHEAELLEIPLELEHLFLEHFAPSWLLSNFETNTNTNTIFL